MFIDTENFIWAAWPDGYRCVETYGSREFTNAGEVKEGARKDFFITMRSPPSASIMEQDMVDGQYNPYDIGWPLHRIFAATKTRKSAILNFAGHYGFLGGELRTVINGPENGLDHEIGERVSDWKNEIVHMRGAIFLSELIQRSDRNGLIAFIENSDDGMMLPNPSKVESKRKADSVILNSTRSSLKKAWESSGLFSSAGTFLCSMIDHGLQHRSRFQFTKMPQLHDAPEWDDWLRRWNKFDELTESERRTLDQDADFIASAGPLSLGPKFSPTCLIGALWLELAVGLSGNKSYGTCEHCGMPFEIATMARKKRFCSLACKQAEYRNRKQRTTEGGA